MHKFMRFILIIFSLVVFFASSSCKKKISYTKNNLSFSNDTIIFDTVFTTVGSTSERLKFYNLNALPIQIEEIELMGGTNSPFKINIDGISGHYHEGLEIPSKDSLFAFIEVTLSVNNQNTPLIIEDSIRFRSNGKDQYVNLVVWGQDAYFHVAESGSAFAFVGDLIDPWLNDKPHVLYGDVALDSGQTLTIPAGTKVYGHKNSRLIIYKSTLNVNGQLGDEVVFKHDRLESFYDNNGGQWQGILFVQANYSTIDYTNVYNANIGIQVDTTGTTNTLKLTNSIIENSAFYNLFLVAGAVVEVENSIFGDAGVNAALLFAGGEANFKHCNFVNFWSGSRGGPAFGIKNYWEVEGVIYVRDFVNTHFDNCVFWGNNTNELIVDTLANSPALFDVTFNNCLAKDEAPYTYSNFVNMIWNLNPLFTDLSIKDYHFEDGSPLDNAGLSTVGTMLDIEGNSRDLSEPDIGAYEN